MKLHYSSLNGLRLIFRLIFYVILPLTMQINRLRCEQKENSRDYNNNNNKSWNPKRGLKLQYCIARSRMTQFLNYNGDNCDIFCADTYVTSNTVSILILVAILKSSQSSYAKYGHITIRWSQLVQCAPRLSVLSSFSGFLMLCPNRKT